MRSYLFLCVVIEWRKYAVRQKSAIFRNKQVFTAIYVHKHAEKIQTHRHTCTIMVQEAKKSSVNLQSRVFAIGLSMWANFRDQASTQPDKTFLLEAALIVVWPLKV